MILESLFKLYKNLAANPDTGIAPPGCGIAPVAWALHLSSEGEIEQLEPLTSEVTRGKKTKQLTMQRLVVPARTIRSTSIAPNFLCDSMAYILAISEKDDSDPAYSYTRQDAFKTLHVALLEKLAGESPTARAVLQFVQNFNPMTVREHPAIAPHLEGLLKGGNVAIKVGGQYAHDDPLMRQVWQNHLDTSEREYGRCLVTGEAAPIARVHAKISGVHGTNSSGAVLVGFNAASFTSYGLEQGANAPVSMEAAFGYTTALNYLLKDAPYSPFFIGDTTMVFWADHPDYERYGRTFAAQFLPPLVGEERERHQQFDSDPALEQDSTPFYILGLAPNAARICVRFFISGTFGGIVQRLRQHYRNTELVRWYESMPPYVALYHIIDGLAPSYARQNFVPSPGLVTGLARACFEGGAYPLALLTSALQRIYTDTGKSDRDFYFCVAGIKTYLQRTRQEELVALNEKLDDQAYILGRILAVAEKAQKDANPRISYTVKDRYLATLAATPAQVFPMVMRAVQQIPRSKFQVRHSRLLRELAGKLAAIPPRLSKEAQGLVILGYYHQVAALYTKSANAVAEGDTAGSDNSDTEAAPVDGAAL